MEDSKPKNSMKYIVGGLIAVVAIVAIVFIVTSKPKDDSADSGSNADSSVVEGARVTAAELNGSVDIEVKFGDYDAMSELAKDIQNGNMTGKIVTIDGVVNHPGMSYSIIEKNEDGSEKKGTVFNIDDEETDSYPKDGDRIKMVAKVVEVSTLNYQLVTLKDFVSEVEE